ncbi:hypothetical protein MMC13_004064 [Lambiella insularis]|nr:hypothetical protein [Lambiella insularis]
MWRRLCKIIRLSIKAHPAHNVEHRDLPGLYYGPDTDNRDFLPVPPIGDGPTIDPTVGYYLEHLGNGTYFITEGFYTTIFLVSDSGVILVDCPPTIGYKLQTAIASVTTQPVTHFIYSHAHSDHVGGAYIFNGTVKEYIAQIETLKNIKNIPTPDPARLLPNVTFQKHKTVHVGNQTLELSYKGPNHQPGNIFIYAPAAKTLMLVDVVFPGWCTRDDVLLQRQYVHDLYTNCANAITGGLNVTQALGPVIGANPGNPWAEFKLFFKDVVDICTEATNKMYVGKLAGMDVFGWEHAYKMVNSLRLDDGILGPFGVMAPAK